MNIQMTVEVLSSFLQEATHCGNFSSWIFIQQADLEQDWFARKSNPFTFICVKSALLFSQRLREGYILAI